MTLLPDEYQRVQYLLGKQQVQHWLAPDEQAELRGLLRRANPEMADADWDSLVQFGLLLLGAYLLIRGLSSKT